MHVLANLERTHRNAGPANNKVFGYRYSEYSATIVIPNNNSKNIPTDFLIFMFRFCKIFTYGYIAFVIYNGLDTYKIAYRKTNS